MPTRNIEKEARRKMIERCWICKWQSQIGNVPLCCWQYIYINYLYYIYIRVVWSLKYGVSVWSKRISIIEDKTHQISFSTIESDLRKSENKTKFRISEEIHLIKPAILKKYPCFTHLIINFSLIEAVMLCNMARLGNRCESVFVFVFTSY